MEAQASPSSFPRTAAPRSGSSGGAETARGEFNDFTGLIALGGDSVLVADGRNNRATILDGEGAVLRVIPFQPMRGFARYGVSGRYDGRFALVPTMTGGSANDPPGWREFPVFLTADLAEFDTVAVVPLMYERSRGSRNPVQLSGRVQAGPDGFVHARADVAQISWYASDDALTQVARWDAEGRDLDDRDWAELEAYARATMRLAPDRLEVLLGQWRQDFSGPLPLFGLLHVDHDGNVWLGDSGLLIRWEDRFEIVSADGVYLGSVRFPSPVWVLDISGTRALVVERDDLDVQAVALYEITKP